MSVAICCSSSVGFLSLPSSKPIFPSFEWTLDFRGELLRAERGRSPREVESKELLLLGSYDKGQKEKIRGGKEKEKRKRPLRYENYPSASLPPQEMILNNVGKGYWNEEKKNY